MSISLALIVARAKNGVIGRDGDLPWRLRSDLQTFKRVTLGKPVIMGRKTWESLPKRPLPGRMNIVLSRDEFYDAPGAITVTSLEEAIEIATEQAHDDGVDEVIVMGGAHIYAQALPLAKTVYLTEVDANVEGDAHFDLPNPETWQEIEHQAFPTSEHDDYPFVVRTLRRKP